MTKYLVGKGVIDPWSVIAGRLEIAPLPGRNYNFRIRDARSDVVLKQGIWLQENRRCFKTECTFYRGMLPRLPQASQDRIPRPALIDDANDLIAIEFLPNAIPMFQFLRSAPALAGNLGAQLGHFLRALHAVDADVIESGFPDGLPSGPPWVMRAHCPGPRQFQLISPGSYQCVKALQARTALCEAIEQERQHWRAERLIHADIKSDNILLASGPGGNWDVHVIDWELIQLGDSAWDIAGFLNDVLLSYVFAPAAARAADTSDPFGPAWATLAPLRPAIQGFISAYQGAGSDELFERAFRLSGIRLVQFALEYAQQHGSIPLHSDLALQLAERVVLNPGFAHALLSPDAIPGDLP